MSRVLELRDISKSYGEGANAVRALDEVNLSVDEGHLVAVMGPSGSGKSTLLTIAGSLEAPTSGEVQIAGASLSSMSSNDKARLRRRTIGYVFQDFNLLPGLTAAENVSLPLELDGVSARKAHLAGLAALEGHRSVGGMRASTTPISSPAASASVWPSLAPWSVSAVSFSPTSHRVRSTRPTARP